MAKRPGKKVKKAIFWNTPTIENQIVMANKVDKFLAFNGKTIFSLAQNGTWWIAIKPVCEALGVQYVRCYKNIKGDPILSRALSNQTMHDASGRLQEMAALPEFYIYGWIMGINSDAPGLNEYKWECYRVLFEHFHGLITGRKELIKQKAANAVSIGHLENRVSATPDAQELGKLRGIQKVIDRSLKQMDKSVYDLELDLFIQSTGPQTSEKVQ
jgi:hypothetical protein